MSITKGFKLPPEECPDCHRLLDAGRCPGKEAPSDHAGQRWHAMSFVERQSVLVEAELWEGNTYARPSWEELPSHIHKCISEAMARIDSGTSEPT